MQLCPCVPSVVPVPSSLLFFINHTKPSAEGSPSGPVCGPGPAQGFPPADVTCLVGQALEICCAVEIWYSASTFISNTSRTRIARINLWQQDMWHFCDIFQLPKNTGLWKLETTGLQHDYIAKQQVGLCTHNSLLTMWSKLQGRKLHSEHVVLCHYRSILEWKHHTALISKFRSRPCHSNV